MKNIIFIISIVIFFTDSLIAETSEEKGLSIAKKSYESTRGFVDSQSDQLMILIDPKGNEVTREISGKTYENTDVSDGDKSIIFFNKPKDVEGTVLLSHTHVNDDDDQWLYLPALGRVKRISSSNKSGAFMGSEIAFEDFSGSDYRKYDWNYLGEEEYQGSTCYKLESFPKYKNSGYTRRVGLIDENLRSRKIDFYDRKDTLLKTLTYEDYKQYLDKFWRSNRLVMINHQTGKKTELLFADWKFRTGMTERDFDKSALKRTR